VTALAWAYLFRLDHQMTADGSSAAMMERMGMVVGGAWTARDFFYTFAMWSVMMVGMMAPSAIPVLLLFNGMHAHRTEGSSPTAGTLFGLGHMSVWIGFSILAAMLQWSLHQAGLLSPGMAVTSSRAAGFILIAAGAYQLTPAKSKCLTKCQSPLGFLLSNWREGPTGALQLGIRHGIYCLGCCWALMCVLFVVGVMNLAWVAVLAAFILIEKSGITGLRIARAGGAVIIAAGVITAMRS
jgi:predicted metal-binding membrane protein